MAELLALLPQAKEAAHVANEAYTATLTAMREAQEATREAESDLQRLLALVTTKAQEDA